MEFQRTAGRSLAASCALGMLALGCGQEAGGGDPGAGTELQERVQNSWFAAGQAAAAQARALHPGGERARNVVLFVGDGLDLVTVTAARILEGQQRGESGEENQLAFESLPYVALARTFNTNQQVPDSAGAMTAIVSGVKTKAGVLGVDENVVPGDVGSVDGAKVPTLLEEAEQRGLATGIVTTTTVTHATPAACYAHSPDRRWENDSLLSEEARAADFPDIARQFVEFPIGDGIDVVLGGGREHFMPLSAHDPEHTERRGARTDGRDLVKEWRARQPEGIYVWNQSQFDAVDASRTSKLLGLFDPSHMNFEADRQADLAGEPSLAEMTAKALDLLEHDPDGFVLMVEGGRIDHGHHMGNAYRALTDTIEFSDAVRVALERVDPSQTLIVVTSDHGHVLTMGGYPVRGNDILGLVRQNSLGEAGPVPRTAEDLAGNPYTTLGYANGPGFPFLSVTEDDYVLHPPGTTVRPDISGVDTTQRDYVQEATVPLLMETHSGEDVPIYAGGPGAALFHGVQDQSYVYHGIAAALGWSEGSDAEL